MFTNFPLPKAYNLGGLVDFYFVPIAGIAQVPNLVNGKITDPVILKDGFSWLKGYATLGTLLYSEEIKKTVHGDYFEKQLGGFLPGDSFEIKNLVETMQGRSFVVRFKEVGGLERLAGSYGDLLKFSADFRTGGARSDLKGYSYSFSGDGTISSPVLI